MGIVSDLVNIHKMNNDLIRLKVERKRNGESTKTIFDYINELDIIDKKGFNYCGITFQDLCDISDKYNLRLKEEEISKVMMSDEQLFNFTLLPIPRMLINDIYMDIYYMMKRKR